MKNKTVKALAILLAATTVSMMGGVGVMASDDTAAEATEEAAADDAAEADDSAETSDDQAAADNVAALIDKIYVQERTDTTDEDCKAAKDAWDALTDAQKELVEGEEASPEYFGADTGDASKDDPRNQDEIGENELLVVSFGTSFNDSRAQDIKGIEDALQEAYPDWSVRRAFTAQIIINHVEARDQENIDNMDQALQRAVDNGVKNLVIQPTHLMHGAEYDEMVEAVDGYKDKFESVAIAEPMLGEVGDDATVINDDKKAVAQAITDEACKEAGYDDMAAAADDGTAFVFMGHGTSHVANVTYDQMQTQMDDLGFTNAFIGTVEGEPEDTECQAVIEKIKDAGFKKVVLRPLMVVAGDHANNDMAGDDEDSWKSQFEAAGAFDTVDTQIAGLGRIQAVEDLYVAHTKDAIDSLGAADDATDDGEDASADAETEVTDDTAEDTEAAE
nr:sirohydrochlorin cobaltochelatase [uncultured Blautia sp.]